jgi:cytochrome c oxidase subunit 2
MSQNTRRDLIRLGILWVVLTILAEAFTAYGIHNYPTVASKQGVVTSEAIFFLLWATVPILVLVVLIVVYSMFRFRVSDDDRQPSDRQYRSGRAFPWSWLAASVVLNALFIIHPGLTGLAALWSMAKAATNATEVDVTAKQWEWSFSYPKQKLTDEEELVVPVDTPIRFVLRSEDVIHSFWVPAWGIKKDMIPGTTRTLVVTPDRIGDTKLDPLMRVQCSQICGVGHAEMQATVRVVSKADFDKWVATEQKAMQEKGSMGGMNMNMPNMKPGAPAGKAPMKMNMNGPGGAGMQNMKPAAPSGMSPSMNMPGQQGGMNMNGAKPAAPSGMSPSMNMKGPGGAGMQNMKPAAPSGMSPSMNMPGQQGGTNMNNAKPAAPSGMSPSMNMKGPGGAGMQNVKPAAPSGMSPSMNMPGQQGGMNNAKPAAPSGMSPSMNMNKSNSSSASSPSTMQMQGGPGGGAMQGEMPKRNQSNDGK